MSRRALLFVCNERDSETATGVLRAFGLDVVVVDSLDAARAETSGRLFDVVVAEWSVLGEDPGRWFRSLRCAAVGGDPILLAVAKAGVPDPSALVEAHVTDFLEVPIDGSALAARLRLAQRRARERRRLRRNHRRRALQKRLQSVGTLAAGVAHEINNPLTYILSNLETLGWALASRTHAANVDREGGAAEIDQMLADAKEGAERIRLIVREMRALSIGREAQRLPVNLHDAIERALHAVEADLAPRARVIRDLRPVPVIEAVPSQVVQLFAQLLRNAAQAIPEGEPAKHWVRVVTRVRKSSSVEVIVADSGRGIAKAQIDRIFEPFYTTRPVGSGTGLGLSICHSIVSGLGGTIDVRSEPRRGTEFRIILPVDGASEAPVTVSS